MRADLKVGRDVAYFHADILDTLPDWVSALQGGSALQPQMWLGDNGAPEQHYRLSHSSSQWGVGQACSVQLPAVHPPSQCLLAFPPRVQVPAAGRW